MAVEDWIDEVCKLWEISDGKGGLVKAFRVYEKAEFPEAMNVFPSVLTFTTRMEPHYGEASYELWEGVSEFHLAPNVDKSNFPNIMLYFARISNAAVSNVLLSGKVSYFELTAVEGPVILRYGSEDPHLGILVRWRVKESVSVNIT